MTNDLVSEQADCSLLGTQAQFSYFFFTHVFIHSFRQFILVHFILRTLLRTFVVLMSDPGIKSILSDYWFLTSIRASEEVSAIIDTGFRYVAVSRGFCSMLKKQRVELEGNYILKVFPEFVKLQNYKNLQRAMEGNEFIDKVPAITGEMFIIHYRPILHNGEILGVHTESRKIQIADLGI